MSSTTYLGYQRLTTGQIQLPSTQPRVSRCSPRQNISAFQRTRHSQTTKTAAAPNRASAATMPSDPEIRSASVEPVRSSPGYSRSVRYEFQSDQAVAQLSDGDDPDQHRGGQAHGLFGAEPAVHRWLTDHVHPLGKR